MYTVMSEDSDMHRAWVREKESSQPSDDGLLLSDLIYSIQRELVRGGRPQLKFGI